MDDTSPEVRRRMIEGYRAMPAWRKARIVFDLYAFTQGLILADVRRHHPGADERECLLRAASRRIDPDLMQKAFGWDPREKGY